MQLIINVVNGFLFLGRIPDGLGFYCFLSVLVLGTNENSKSQTTPIVWAERAQIWRIGSVSIFHTRPRSVSIKHGLRTTDYGLGIKHGLRYKRRTKHYGLKTRTRV